MSVKNMLMDNIAGIVLAGGRSSRMGEDKALLAFNGVPLIEYMLELLRKSGLEDIYISGEVEGYDAIPDPDPFAGPAQAIIHTMKTLSQYKAFLFVPVDMPFLTPSVLHELTVYENGAHYEGWPLPLYTPPRSVAGDAQSVKKLIKNLNIESLPLPLESANAFINLNTPEDWKEAVNR